MQGFFSKEALLKKGPAPTLPLCGACKLHKKCESPKMEPIGDEGSDILFVSESPGTEEDKQGRHLVGNIGRFFKDDILKRRLNFDIKNEAWLTNAILCCPEPEDEKKTDITDAHITYCRPALTKTLNELKPRLIIPMGTIAVKSVLAGLWKDEEEGIGGITRWADWQIPCRKLNAWICPIYNPAHIVYEVRQRPRAEGRILKDYARQVEAALSPKGRPYKDNTTDFRKQIHIEYDDKKAAKFIRRVIKQGGLAAFDYECDRLKPDHPDARIVSCSICHNGEETWAFPWHGEVIPAMREFVRSSIGKIAANIKFEARWTKSKLGVWVKNWRLDTMLSGHLLDFREGISGLKFQTFVNFGIEAYDNVVEQYFKGAKDSNSPNRIKECDLRSLLLYNGLDSLFEYMLAQKHAQPLKRKL